MTSNWKQALEATLQCKHCGAANRPGVRYVELQQDGQALCSVCSKHFTPEAA